MKIFKFIIRIIAGSVFIFSGTVKGIDPLGSSYKFHDYLQAFGLDFLQPLTMPLAVLLCLAEFLTGFSVLTGVRYREGILGMFLLIAFFTPLTFVLALTNPVSDCGCFGDAIHMTNWQTFGKNLVLFILILILFIERKNRREPSGTLAGWIIIFSTALIFVLFNLYNLRFLPVIDFLPYRVGNNIPELMKIPDGETPDRYETTFIYQKEGTRKEFTLENYPANDSTWVFVDSKTILVEKGYVPPVHDFSVTTRNNENITDSILSNNGFTFLMISRKLGMADAGKLAEGFATGKKCMAEGIDFHILTASGSGETENFDEGLNFCTTDETTLKSMVRANPGYIMLKNGTITGKWSWANLPDDIEELKKQDN